MALFFLTLVTSAGTSRVGAQEGGSLSEGGGAPAIGEHRFSPISTLDHPFITTFVRSTLGMGQAKNVDMGTVVVGNDTLVDFKGDLLLATFELEYQHAVKDWLAARASVDVLGRLGTDVEALVGNGIRASLGYEFGWLLRVTESDRVLLTGDLFLTNHSFTTVDLQRFVDDLVTGNPPSLVRSSPAVRGGGGLRFAWGVSSLFGLTAISSLAYGESPLQTQPNQWTYGIGLTLDFDLGAVTPVPLGVTAGGRAASYPRIGDDTSDALISTAVTVAYNGHRNFLIGVESRVERYRLAGTNAKVTGPTISLTTQYFF